MLLSCQLLKTTAAAAEKKCAPTARIAAGAAEVPVRTDVGGAATKATRAAMRAREQEPWQRLKPSPQYAHARESVAPLCKTPECVSSGVRRNGCPHPALESDGVGKRLARIVAVLCYMASAPTRKHLGAHFFVAHGSDEPRAYERRGRTVHNSASASHMHVRHRATHKVQGPWMHNVMLLRAPHMEPEACVRLARGATHTDGYVHSVHRAAHSDAYDAHIHTQCPQAIYTGCTEPPERALCECSVYDATRCDHDQRGGVCRHNGGTRGLPCLYTSTEEKGAHVQAMEVAEDSCAPLDTG